MTDEKGNWWQGPVYCYMCGHIYRAVVELPREQSSPELYLECSRCGKMSVLPIDYGLCDDDNYEGP